MPRTPEPQRRETILRAASEVFSEQGYSDTRLADIAQRAGIAISTLYPYFSSKEEMVFAIAQENRHALLAQLRPVLEHFKGEEDITRFVEIVLAFAKEHRDQIIVFNLESGLRTAHPRRRGAARGKRFEKGIEIVSQLIAAGALSPYDPELLLDMLFTMTRWIISKSLTTTGEEEPLKRFCVQWLSQALLPRG